ncbi:MAG: iron hydrogenase small subunit [Syntrophaceae bacterium]
MSAEEYQYIENPMSVSRREFLSISGALIALTALPAAVVRRMAVKRNDYIRARTAGLYKDDTNAKVRVSHANQGVSRLYQDFLGNPLSEVSEELLHTRYIDRSRAMA